MSINLKDREATHRLMYDAHWALVRAKEKLHAVAIDLYATGTHVESRREIATPLASIEKARDAIDSALSLAGEGRSGIIRATGCDGTCSKSEIAAIAGDATA